MDSLPLYHSASEFGVLSLTLARYYLNPKAQRHRREEVATKNYCVLVCDCLLIQLSASSSPWCWTLLFLAVERTAASALPWDEEGELLTPLPSLANHPPPPHDDCPPYYLSYFFFAPSSAVGSHHLGSGQHGFAQHTHGSSPQRHRSRPLRSSERSERSSTVRPCEGSSGTDSKTVLRSDQAPQGVSSVTPPLIAALGVYYPPKTQLSPPP